MKKINFVENVLPHVVAIAAFLLVTIFFFNPVFFDNKVIEQQDIQQWEGSAKALRDYRDQTGKEGLWAESMFSGMPAYLIHVQWSNGVVSFLKKIMAFGLPHPIANIFLSFLCYYILLLAFRVRPYLAISGALAFGLSSYMIIGVIAGHNARIGAIAFMPLVVAGIQLAFTGKRILGLGVTTVGMALHLRENHLQVTYYLMLLVVAYGIVQLIYAIRDKKVVDFAKTIGVLIAAVCIAVGSFIGPLWAVAEYSPYTIRGKSELTATATQPAGTGLNREYAFQYSYGILEPFTLLIPNFYGGSSSNYLVNDQNSKVYQALASSGNQQLANQLAQYTSSYWGPQPFTSPYYAGAIIVFLFAIGIAFGDKKILWWLLPISLFAIGLTWGSSFKSFNYFLFDYLPGYNKFRSVTFALVITLFAMPLAGMLGLEKILAKGIDKAARKKIWIALASTGGLCFLLIVFAGMFSFLRAEESELPTWFAQALADDRKSFFRSDAIRSLAFILAAFLVIFFDVQRKISPIAFYIFLTFMIVVDLSVVDKRYLTKDNYQRKRENKFLALTEADQEILKDKSYYRVFYLQQWYEARTSYYHNSLGGYHGARLRRYQDLYDSCITQQTSQFIQDARAGQLDFNQYGVLNMLNTKYIMYGSERSNIIPNPAANGAAWFVQQIESVNSPDEELRKVCALNTREVAVMDASKFTIPSDEPDSSASIKIIEHNPNYLKYESTSSKTGLAVFSEIYFPKGWKAFINNKPVEILRANYVLRALAVPAGNNIIEFKFEPDAYYVGNKITMASSWMVLLVLLGSIGWSFKKSGS
ncbi:MAG: hypothetical protein JNM57_00385 [Cyclobacteriaceae bacterium]|nr:hypothetical protein [Cyclobacteriaceae bacterium]